MKIFTVSAVFVLLSLTAYAQHTEQATREFKPMKESKLELNFLDRKASSGLDQFKKPSESLTLRPKTSKSASPPGAKTQLAALPDRMPILMPDSTVLFPMLAAAPDSTVLYHLQVKKPSTGEAP